MQIYTKNSVHQIIALKKVCYLYNYLQTNVKNLSMELKMFIKNTLTDIVEGIKEAKEVYSKNGGALSPELKAPVINSNIERVEGKYYKEISNIEFEISLTNEDKEGNTSGIGVMLGSINIGAKKDANTTENVATKIKFTVPVIFP